MTLLGVDRISELPPHNFGQCHVGLTQMQVAMAQGIVGKPQTLLRAPISKVPQLATPMLARARISRGSKLAALQGKPLTTMGMALG